MALGGLACHQQDSAPDAAPQLWDLGQAAVPGTWVTVPSGTFLMGSPYTEPCRFKNERQRTVTLTRSFEVQTTEVTLAQMRAVMGYDPRRFIPYLADGGPDTPVHGIWPFEAMAYCNALSRRAGLAPCYLCTGSDVQVQCRINADALAAGYYGCPGYRLPTEAEWEYAYRAGTQTAFYNGANDPQQCGYCGEDANAAKIALYCGSFDYRDVPVVGQMQPNAWGLYDMAGSVWEYVQDRYLADPGPKPAVDPGYELKEFPQGDFVRRGGSFKSQAASLRAAVRSIGAGRSHMGGFRCVRSLAP